MSFLKKITKSPQRVGNLGSSRGSQVEVGLGSTNGVSHSQDPAGGEAGRTPFALHLGEYNLVYDDGQWYSQNIGKEDNNDETLSQLRKQNKMLIEENNMLKYKVEVLIDMLSVSKADVQSLENALNKAKGASSSPKRK